ncbi:Omega-3 fatty acid desaturase fat-1 [Caenorhabditis elegans]|uniref:Omega-3 fatty acid desaturase fat-1 n=1 Tax=Caenorhabditis elegans TaxID=6239 RepID=FAT1_CAEEL|nr:Omega-3 fatty acid desaturase fat-1 [Caenorhabditis elegans]Q9NEQ0.1 RecName: Full=Omega-3 fatty acid desaturase fat-1; Short=FAT-1; AltName: Full=FAT-1 N3 desaturase; AltName: Full=Fatty acid desaturase 1; AltName: Full=Fatty acid metabolism 1 [Caenorhabditis elegans]AZR68160.1 omega-3 desaturase [synthetic construct]CAC44309.1 Omega-3 fatty acid desaturase fat-1 [Caenorhabditis elegans]|eukprot:NP_001023560.1 Omega-3 fatty acid desaturase fat-1 [Caenorhabditis elegans]
MVAHSSEGLSATAPVTGGDVLVDARASLEEKEAPRDVNANTKQATTEEPRIQLPTVDAFRRAIPAHCFERDLVKSIRYLVQDFAALTILYFALPAFEYFGLFGYLVWNIFMGVFGFALFVVGHDCLHGSFSDNQNLNDFIGHIAFSPLFSPYFPWQKSHKLHHAFTNHIDKDHGHVWIQDKDWEAMPSWKRWFNPIPFSGWLKWFPVYTLFGFCDGSHFWPYSSLFVRNSERVQCVISGICCCVCAYIALTIAGSYSNWFWYYWVPLSFFGLMLVIVTYLQHVDDVAEVYEADEWSFVRGQTQTIDRYYGLGLDTTMHHITDGHVAHHFFNKIPHYHLIEATEGVKKVLEPLSDTQYGYKSQVNYDFFARFLWFNYKLDYLVHKTAGIMQFRTTLEEKAKAK